MTIPYEDRTLEGPEQVASRRARAVGAALIQTSLALSQDETPDALRALASALGQAVAQTGIPLNKVIALIRKERDAMRESLEEQAHLYARNADA